MFTITLQIGPKTGVRVEDLPPGIEDAIGLIGISMDTSMALDALHGVSPGVNNPLIYAAHEATLAFARFLADVLTQMANRHCMMCKVSEMDDLKEVLYHRIQDAMSLYLTDVYAADARPEPGPQEPPDWNSMFRFFAQENKGDEEG